MTVSPTISTRRDLIMLIISIAFSGINLVRECQSRFKISQNLEVKKCLEKGNKTGSTSFGLLANLV
jgi:hypothetical protein